MVYPRKSAFAAPYMEIVGRLVRRRREIGMTQEQLGEAFGENQSFISRIERCQRRMDVYEFVRFCRILQAEPAAILSDIEG